MFTPLGVIFYLYCNVFDGDMGVILILHVWCISLFETKWLRHVFNSLHSIRHKKLDTYLWTWMNGQKICLKQSGLDMFSIHTFHSIHRKKLDKNLLMDIDEWSKNFSWNIIIWIEKIRKLSSNRFEIKSLQKFLKV